MKFWYDFEFVEQGNEYPIFPLSLGMVAEDGREYYRQYIDGIHPAIRHDWVRENVLPQLQHLKWVSPPNGGYQGGHLTVCGGLDGDHTDEHSQKHGWKKEDCPWISTKEAALDLTLFLTAKAPSRAIGISRDVQVIQPKQVSNQPELWGYYADYDHVCYAQLFGAMIGLPAGFPRWTRDIKQLAWMLGDPTLPEQGEGEHNALEDARWNKQSYDFLVEEFRRLRDNGLVAHTIGPVLGVQE